MNQPTRNEIIRRWHGGASMRLIARDLRISRNSVRRVLDEYARDRAEGSGHPDLPPPFGLVRHAVFFVIELSSRRVQIAGVAPDPDGSWMHQIARNLTDCCDGFLADTRYLIHDRDPLYTAQFTTTLASAGIRCVKLAPKSPNLNAYAERFVRSIKSECLDRMIFFGEKHLRHVIDEYIEHYHAERNHQGIGNRLIDPGIEVGVGGGAVVHRERLGGMLSFYHRHAA